MSILLFVIGAITLVLGAITIGFGIPINEFSFGNTLIMAGTTAAVGGLIVIGLGAVVVHLQRLAEVVATRAPLRPNRPPDVVEAGQMPAASRISVPPMSMPEPALGEAPPVEPPLTAPPAMPAEEFPAQVETPTLPNPDISPLEPVEEMARAASPVQPPFAEPPPSTEFGERAVPVSHPPPGFNGAGGEQEPEPLPAWLSTARAPESAPSAPPQSQEEAKFEAVWPAEESRTVGRAAAEESETPAAAPVVPLEPAPVPETKAPAPTSERRNVAILKSGVVDGMAYTLYVDGSIEAELPQGTLHFASINDLRQHLEKAS